MMLVAVGFAFIKLASSGEHIMLGSVLMVIGATVAVSSEFVLGCMSWLSASPAIRVKVESKDENSS